MFAVYVYAFIQRLSRRRSLFEIHAQLVKSVLLHGTGDEGRRSVRLRYFFYRFLHYVFIVFVKLAYYLVKLFFVAYFKFFTFSLFQCGAHNVAVLLEIREKQPVLFRLKRAYFALSFDDKTQCNRLNAPRGQIVVYFFTQDGGKFVAHQSIQYTSCLLRVHQIFVYRARVRQSVFDGFFAYFVEFRPNRFVRVYAQYVCNMP